jgi:(p)ppGpp synthase/HD superfamily hydrolase
MKDFDDDLIPYLHDNDFAELKRIQSDPSYFINNKFYPRAQSIAYDSHRKYHAKSGVDYFLHAHDIIKKLNTCDEVIVGFLYGAVKYSDLNLKELKKEGFPRKIIKAVDAITRRDSEDYFEFINRAKKNIIGRKVLIIDTNLNIDLLRKSNSIEKDKINVEDYRKALAILRSVKKNKLELFLSNWYNR